MSRVRLDTGPLGRPSAPKLMKSLGVSVLLLSIGATAYGQVPPSNDTSDANYNTGMGTGTLQSNTTGGGNTASGYSALSSNSTGSGNTASGYWALLDNTTGDNNTAIGQYTLWNNSTGFSNSVLGGSALSSNTTGAQNTAIGGAALLYNTTGNNNVGVGMNAGLNITTGNQNIAVGLDAGSNITTGNGNIVIGQSAGANLTTGNRNIDIGNGGIAGEGHTIRIGDAGFQTKTFVAGIWASQVKPGSPVFVTSDGQLGVVGSSERYKTDIAPMGSRTSKIGQLRPVTFHLKSDSTGELQYGLIAEEVDRVFPELVIRNEASGRIEGVRYDELAPMLLNEVQQQQQKLATQAEQIAVQAEQIAALKQQFAELQELNHEMQLALSKLQPKDSRVAMR